MLCPWPAHGRITEAPGSVGEPASDVHAHIGFEHTLLYCFFPELLISCVLAETVSIVLRCIEFAKIGLVYPPSSGPMPWLPGVQTIQGSRSKSREQGNECAGVRLLDRARLPARQGLDPAPSWNG